MSPPRLDDTTKNPANISRGVAHHLANASGICQEPPVQNRNPVLVN